MADFLPTPQDIRDVVSTDVSDAVLQSVIDEAYLIVSGCIEGMEDERKKAIIKWVAAHILFCTGKVTNSRSMTITSKKLGDASETYQSAAFGAGLTSSPYGKRAIDLDPSGCLMGIGAEGKRKACFVVL